MILFIDHLNRGNALANVLCIGNLTWYREIGLLYFIFCVMKTYQ